MATPESHSSKISDPSLVGPRTKTLVLFGLSVVTAGLVGAWLGGGFATTEDADHDHEAANGNGDTQWYISGMHPWIIQPEPGYCPVCGMELTPLEPSMLTGALGLDPNMVQSIGVRVATAKERRLERELLSLGAITVDESRLHKMVLRSDGYIERLAVNRSGDRVAAGQVVAEIHSPRVLNAAGELFSLLRQSDPRDRLVEAARRQLRILGVHPDQIEEWENSGEAEWTYRVYSPVDGIVERIAAYSGDRLNEGGMLLEIADLSRVWLQAAVYENQLAAVRQGSSAKIEFQAFPGQLTEGRVDYLYPTMDARNRQVRARIELENPEMHYRPGMFAKVHFAGEETESTVVVPRSALLDTGNRQLVYVNKGRGQFEPREVVAGVESENGWVQILEGIEAGESVVVSGQFLIDSESRLRESLLRRIDGDFAIEETDDDGPAASEVGALEADSIPLWIEWIEAYLDLGDRLIEDDIEGASGAIESLQDRSRALQDHGDDGLMDLAERGAEVPLSEDIQEVRLAYEKAGRAFISLAEAVGIPDEWEGALQKVLCPMFPDFGDNGWWVQREGRILNPLWGSAMLTCYDAADTLPRMSEVHDHD